LSKKIPFVDDCTFWGALRFFVRNKANCYFFD